VAIELTEIVIQYGALGLLAYLVFWLTKRLTKKMDMVCNHLSKLNENIEDLNDKIDKLSDRVDILGNSVSGMGKEIQKLRDIVDKKMI